MNHEPFKTLWIDVVFAEVATTGHELARYRRREYLPSNTVSWYDEHDNELSGSVKDHLEHKLGDLAGLE